MSRVPAPATRAPAWLRRFAGMGYLLPMMPIPQSPATEVRPLTGHEPLFIVLINDFGRRYGISQDTEAALHGLIGGELRPVRVGLLNNCLRLEHIGIGPTERDRNRLMAMATRLVGTLAFYGLLLRGLFSRLGDAEHVVNFVFDRLAVSIRGRRRVKGAMDGEISWMDAPLEFKVSDTPLPLIVPADAPDGARP